MQILILYFCENIKLLKPVAVFASTDVLSVGIKTPLKVNKYTYIKQNTKKRTKSNIYQGPLSGITYVISPLQNISVIGFW